MVNKKQASPGSMAGYGKKIVQEGAALPRGRCASRFDHG